MAENQVQERDQDVVTYETFTGLRGDVTPERFGSGDLAIGDNVDLDKSGRLARRDGYVLTLAGPAHSLWADAMQEFCLFVSGSQLMRLAADFSAHPIKSLVDGQSRLSAERVSDRVYFSNGTDTGIIERATGAARSWGLPVPPLPTPSVTVGQMPAGTYQFAATYWRTDGQESGAPRAGTITVGDGAGLSFAMPSSLDPDVASKALYLSTPNGEVLYLAGLMDNAAQTFTYANDTTELSYPIATQFLGPAPAGQLVAFYRGRMFVAVGDVLFYSSGFGYELFDLREYVALDGRITMLAPMTDKELGDSARGSGFFVGTDRSCGVLVGSDPKDFQYVPKANYGAVPGALDFVDGSLFGDDSAGVRELPVWLTTQGICVGMPELTIRNITRSRYPFAAGGQGAALFMSGPNRYIATANL
ncbi:hypothetical protein [Burkholderia cenocepacia]|uniref:hypothetical protein n=1 Tax=Burkholderia cenocepacia TaxID=95486 RepID=UPI002ABDB172|nr:hypothetical protein [Burkholderia cenocepacia]